MALRPDFALIICHDALFAFCTQLHSKRTNFEQWLRQAIYCVLASLVNIYEHTSYTTNCLKLLPTGKLTVTNCCTNNRRIAKTICIGLVRDRWKCFSKLVPIRNYYLPLAIKMEINHNSHTACECVCVCVSRDLSHFLWCSLFLAAAASHRTAARIQFKLKETLLEKISFLQELSGRKKLTVCVL